MGMVSPHLVSYFKDWRYGPESNKDEFCLVVAQPLFTTYWCALARESSMQLDINSLSSARFWSQSANRSQSYVHNFRITSHLVTRITLHRNGVGIFNNYSKKKKKKRRLAFPLWYNSHHEVCRKCNSILLDCCFFPGLLRYESVTTNSLPHIPSYPVCLSR